MFTPETTRARDKFDQATLDRYWPAPKLKPGETWTDQRLPGLPHFRVTTLGRCWDARRGRWSPATPVDWRDREDEDSPIEPHQATEMRELHADGWTVRDLADMFDVGTHYTVDVLHGRRHRTAPGPIVDENTHAVKYTHKQATEMRKQFAGADMTVREFAAMYGESEQYMRSLLTKRHGGDGGPDYAG